MNFKSAMEKMKCGSKVTRKDWIGSIYFVMDGQQVKSFTPELRPFIYTEDIMVSEEWEVEDVEGTFSFYDIIDYLKEGKTAKLMNWKNEYIKYDRNDKQLSQFRMAEFTYIPEFEAFVAEDWVELS